MSHFISFLCLPSPLPEMECKDNFFFISTQFFKLFLFVFFNKKSILCDAYLQTERCKNKSAFQTNLFYSLFVVEMVTYFYKFTFQRLD